MDSKQYLIDIQQLHKKQQQQQQNQQRQQLQQKQKQRKQQHMHDHIQQQYLQQNFQIKSNNKIKQTKMKIDKNKLK